MTVIGAFAPLGVSILAAGSLKSEMFPKDDGRNLGDYRDAARYA